MFLSRLAVSAGVGRSGRSPLQLAFPLPVEIPTQLMHVQAVISTLLTIQVTLGMLVLLEKLPVEGGASYPTS